MGAMTRPGWGSRAVLIAALAVLSAPTAALLPTASADSAVCTSSGCAFQSPNRAIDCTVSVQSPSGTPDAAFCAWSDESRALTVTLLPSGALEPCINQFLDQYDNCTWQAQSALPVLGYGQTAVLGPFTCLAEAAAITCTAMPSGRGFTINSTGILPAAVPVPAAPPAEAPPPPPPAEPIEPPPSPPASDEAIA